MATDDNSKVSICIPRVDMWVTEQYIRKIFSEVLLDGTEGDHVDIDPIEKIDLIIRKNEKDETYRRAFIHFNNWHLLNSRAAKLIWDKIHAGEVVKIMHANPSYWKCSLNRVSRVQPQNRNTTPNDNIRQQAFLVE